MNLYPLLRQLLFCFDPETIHGATLQAIRAVAAIPVGRFLLRRLFAVPDGRFQVQAFGLTFRHPVGLAAGYDKNGIAVEGLACLGFSHIEVGTVTPLPQRGNPRPRVFRLPEDRAIINRMGFPGDGAEVVARRLSRLPRGRDYLVGVNIGKGLDTPLEEAARDYIALVRAFHPYADYLAVNVSSPNTLGLRQLQSRHYLQGLLVAILSECRALEKTTGRRVPLLVKVAPDLTWQELDDVLDVLLAARADGVIATNTTVSREGVTSPLGREEGGLSGAPLRQRATAMVQYIHEHAGARLPVVAVGGIFTARDALEKLEAGACLVQVYTGLIYEGPGIVGRILRGYAFPASGEGARRLGRIVRPQN